MNRDEIFKVINLLEGKYEVSKWTVNDVRVWPIIRIRLLKKLYSKGASSQKEEFSNKLKKIIVIGLDKVKKLFNILVGVYEYQKLRFRISKGVDYLFISYTSHRQEINGFYYNRFCDLFINRFLNQNKKVLLLEFKGNLPNYKRPRNYETLVYPTDNAIRAYTKVFSNKKVFVQNLECYQDFLNEVETLFDKSVTNNLSIKQIVQTAKDLDKYADFFSSLFCIAKPKMVFCVSYYSSHAQALILSAYRSKIPSVDIQHGIQGDLHEAYGNWNKAPNEGYNLLPKIFWNWNEKSSAIITLWTVNNLFHYSINGGNPWLLMWKENNFQKIYDQKVLDQIINNKKVVLYTLQPSFDPFPDFIVNAINTTKQEYIWLVRVHPRQIENYDAIEKKLYSIVDGENVEISKATELPLPYLLSISNVHLTVYSTVAIEAAGYNIPTLFITKLGKQYFYNQIPEHLAYYDLENESSLLEALHLASSKEQQFLVDYDFDKVFNALVENEIN